MREGRAKLLIVLRLTCCVVVLVACACKKSDQPADVEPPALLDGPNVLLMTLDTTRADRLSCYGYPKQTSPNLDRLAQDGTLFDRAIAQAAVTPVSHASIMTGLDPYQHGLRVMHGRSRNRLAEDKVTLAEVLKRSGYQTAAFVSAFPVSERFGFSQGFDTFDADFGEAAADGTVSDSGVVNTGRAQRRADETTARALSWLADRPAGPFFLWLHYFDPHDPHFLPPPEYLMTFDMPPDVVQDTRRRLRAVYDIEVQFMDSHIGRLLDGLKDRGLYDDLVVVVVADHGEGLGDHDWWTHGILYQEQIRVPLIVKAPGGAERAGGRRVEDLVRTIDIVPTVLELVGLGPEYWPRVQGHSLVSLLGGQADDQRLVAYSDSVNKLTYRFAEGLTDNKDDMLFAVVDWPWKYIYHRDRPAESELYNLADDPGELNNLLNDQPDQAKHLIDELSSRSFLPADAPEDGAMSPEDVARLKSLGYTK